MTQRLHLYFSGDVQGIGFRFYTRERAQGLKLKGWVRNLPDGRVEIEVEGPEEIVKKFMHEMRTGSLYAQIKEIEENTMPLTGQRDPFDIY